MVDEIKGPINLQRSLPTKELRKAQDNSGDSDLNVDYKLSLKTHDAVMEKLDNWVTKGPESA